MTVEIISWSISTKVWYRAGIELATPGSAVRHASVARHVTDCARRPCWHIFWCKLDHTHLVAFMVFLLKCMSSKCLFLAINIYLNNVICEQQKEVMRLTQSKMLLTIHEHRSKIARNSVFNCHLSPIGQQMACTQTLFGRRLSIDSINVFHCRLSYNRQFPINFIWVLVNAYAANQSLWPIYDILIHVCFFANVL